MAFSIGGLGLPPPPAFEHKIQLIPQRATMGCWEAAATMVMGYGPSCLGTGRATATVEDGMVASDANIQAFAAHHGMTFHPPHRSIMLEELQRLIVQSPVWAAGAVPMGHAYVFGGYAGQGLHIYDPWPVNTGNIYWEDYDQWMRKYPLAIVWLLTR